MTIKAADKPSISNLSINALTCATFKIDGAKLYVPAVTFLTQDDNILLTQLKR